jgi:hypothetical protein
VIFHVHILLTLITSVSNFFFSSIFLGMNHDGMIRLRQEQRWPPTLPREPIIILPWQ